MDNTTVKNRQPFDDYGSMEEAMAPESFREDKDTDEGQLFLTPWQMIIRRFFQNKLAVIGLVALVVMFLFCFAGPLFYPYSETEQFYFDKDTGEELRADSDSEALVSSILQSMIPPSKTHILGTTKLGQDMLSRLMYGGRVSLIVGFVVVLLELVLGIILGGLAGYYGKWVDGVVMRLVDIISSIPFMPLMLLISALMISMGISPRYKIYVTMVLLGLIFWTTVARMVRGSILSLREMEFMQAADAVGIRPRNKIFRHLIPNTLPNLIVTATLSLGSIILMESTMSFLGVGVGLPFASWGNMVSLVNDNLVMRDFPNLWVPPGLCILVTVLAFNFVGDGLRDATDPKMKGR
ncbi:ABC transporter permease [Ruminococcaceae bacterium OttesenSCG-928-D13]|nr:ABC transporter permease [Ruminococcaceae bacterium OttesenSCG-928-D13]